MYPLMHSVAIYAYAIQARDDPRDHLIKGSVIAANQTAFPFSIDSFPPLANSEVRAFALLPTETRSNVNHAWLLYFGG